jgi:hypothetical protein
LLSMPSRTRLWNFFPMRHERFAGSVMDALSAPFAIRCPVQRPITIGPSTLSTSSG